MPAWITLQSKATAGAGILTNCWYCTYGNFLILSPYPLPLHRIDYLQALELDASYLPARVNLAILHQAEGRFQQAWDELTATLERNKCEDN